MLQTIQKSSTGGRTNHHIVYLEVTVQILSQIARPNANEYWAYQILNCRYV